jgi:staphylococcal nuclease domain-containing protein 1
MFLFIMQNGLARLEKLKRWDAPEKKEAFKKYEEFQDEAKKSRLNIWMYGDVESDEEDTPRRPAGRR